MQQPRALDPPYPYIISIYSFKNPHLKKIIHAIKYFHRKDLIPPLASVLAHALLQEEISSFIVVPIPMSRLRKYARGYNHAEALADEIAERLHLTVQNDLLLRATSKKRQVLTRSRGERLKNQRNAFKVETDLHGKKILLVDDVTTTGATLSEARKALLKNGAACVRAVTIAH